MKTKVFAQILILTILGTAIVQAQENISREIKKEMRSAKREIRKAKKEIKNDMEDIEWDVIHDETDHLETIFESPEWISDHVMVICKDHIADLEDMLVDLDENLIHLEELELEAPLFHLEIPEIDLRTPEVVFAKNFFEDKGNVMELSKELENVSISKDFYFDVKDGEGILGMNIKGSLSEGELTITVKKPDGEVYQKFQLSPLADVDWNQQLKLAEEGEAYAGKWTINLSGSGASGYYRVKFNAK